MDAYQQRRPKRKRGSTDLSSTAYHSSLNGVYKPWGKMGRFAKGPAPNILKRPINQLPKRQQQPGTSSPPKTF